MVAFVSAISFPRDFAKWNRAYRGAYMKGVHAALEGHAFSECPYVDIRKPSGKLSWSRAFIRAWQDGWQYADSDRESAKTTAQFSGSFNKHHT